MKRNWDPSSSSYSAAASQNPEEGGWIHPYASAYSSIPIPSNPSPLQNSVNAQFYDSAGYGTNEPAEKRSKVSGDGVGMGMTRDGSSQGRGDDSDGDDDEDDEDDDEDGDQQNSGKGTPARKNSKVAKGPDGKPKVKLTRGSRWVHASGRRHRFVDVADRPRFRACIACRKIKMRCIPDESSGPGGPCKVGQTHQTTRSRG
jgi:hypothetical protein